MSSNNFKRPNPLPLLTCWRTNLYTIPLFILATGFFGSCALFVSLFEKSGRIQHRIAQFWAWWLVRFSGAKLTIEGTENLKLPTNAVYISNHTSFMDTPVIFSALPFQFRILARKQLWRIPFIGWYLGRSGQIPIDTGNPQASLSSLGIGLKALRNGMNIFVFPEGGRTSNGVMRPFLAGAAYLAIRGKVPIVPIALEGVYDLLPIHTRHMFPRPILMRVGKPISTEGYTLRQVDELNEKLRETIQQMLSN